MEKGEAVIRALLALAILSSAVAAQMAPSHEPTSPQASPHGQMTVTQSGNPHGASSARQRFAKECGIANAAPEKATVLARGSDGMWRVIKSDADERPTDDAKARIWHEEGPWFVMLQESGADAAWLHTADMCFNSGEKLTRMKDSYLDTQKKVQRTTEVKNGKSATSFTDLAGTATAKPEQPMAGAYDFKKLEQLPFYGFIKKK